MLIVARRKGHSQSSPFCSQQSSRCGRSADAPCQPEPYGPAVGNRELTVKCGPVLIRSPLINSEHFYFVLNSTYSLFKWLLFFSKLMKISSSGGFLCLHSVHIYPHDFKPYLHLKSSVCLQCCVLKSIACGKWAVLKPTA